MPQSGLAHGKLVKRFPLQRFPETLIRFGPCVKLRQR